VSAVSPNVVSARSTITKAEERAMSDENEPAKPGDEKKPTGGQSVTEPQRHAPPPPKQHGNDDERVTETPAPHPH